MSELIAVDIFVFVLGTAIGSFLNVCIYRFPRGESIISPGSHCPHCDKPVQWRDNVPILGYLLLRGKCRHCQTRLTPRYLIVELIVGAIWLISWRYHGPSVAALSGAIFLSILFSVSITDLETGYIPDKFTLPGMMMALVLATISPESVGKSIWYEGLGKACAGLLGGGGILLATGLLGNLIFRKESMGGGDIKLLALIGAFIGFQKTIFVFFLSPMVAVPVAIYAKLAKKHETIPFGPYLAITGAWFYFYGDPFIARYFDYLQS